MLSYLHLSTADSIVVFPSPKLGADVLRLPLFIRIKALPIAGKPLDLLTSEWSSLTNVP